MTFETLKKTTLATVAAAVLATGFSIAGTEDAHAGRKDFWAGVGAGVVTGVIVNEVVRDRRDRRYHRRASAWDAHVDWCYDRYRSYRERDNTFKPYGKRRRQCYSPYYN